MIRIVTISLLAAGLLSATLLFYQQFLRSQIPAKITREQAIAIAVDEAKSNNFGMLRAGNYVTQAQLIHVRSNGFAFVVDEKSLEDNLAVSDRVDEKYEGQYIWKVRIGATPENKSMGINDGWESWIDAADGEILLSATNRGILYEK